MLHQGTSNKRPTDIATTNETIMNNNHHHNNDYDNNNDVIISTGLHLSFHDHHHHHLQQQFQREIHHLLHAQTHQLRRTLSANTNRHYHALLLALHHSISTKLNHKQAHVDHATRRRVELEARAAQLTVEAQMWQAKARSQEAVAAQLQQAIIKCGGRPGAVEEEGGAGRCSATDAESVYEDPDRAAVAAVLKCRACRITAATVVALPCRHLCLCTECDGVVPACPVCLQLKTSSVEVLLC